MCKGEEGSGGGAVTSELVLVGGDGESVEFWKQKALQNFGSGTKEGNWAVVGAKAGWLPVFRRGKTIANFQMEGISAWLKER